MSPRTLAITGIALLAAGAAVGAAVVLVPAVSAVDGWWNGAMADVRSAVPVVGIARVLNHAGGGWIATWAVPLGLILLLLVMRRWRAVPFAVIAMIASTGAVQLIKTLVARARPEDMLVGSDFGSFPSGHTAHAATLAIVLCLVFPRIWMIVIGGAWTISMALSRTVLSVHWLTDTIGGALVGAGAALLIGALFARWAPLARRRAPRTEG
ncbi:MULTISPECIES: phosphatase PAP2 family protein [unclassified Microbacterium]|uniref:phosphatase PAP2 family protein n=1 Tax=unclassified Microbacterium TaxID=2609290 RepID=UPI00097EAC85|nr:phosphatase PAP2 family protein [Microbacterium sp. JB110]RCS60179.1 phosphatase PAP2 family protein [Microbacterium sp. JB110]SJM48076.1 Pap2 superfamily protein [Frigoribacterium sp. JB110]